MKKHKTVDKCDHEHSDAKIHIDSENGKFSVDVQGDDYDVGNLLVNALLQMPDHVTALILDAVDFYINEYDEPVESDEPKCECSDRTRFETFEEFMEMAQEHWDNHLND